MVDSEISGFNVSAHVFLQRYNVFLQNHGMGIKTNERKNMIERLYLGMQLKKHPKFLNEYGIYISPEMEILARACYIRALNGLDSIIPISGDTGVGKTSWTYAFSTTYAGISKQAFSLQDNLIINEDRDYTMKLFEPDASVRNCLA